MTRDLGVWTAEDSALVLIDYQNEMFEVIRSETNADLAELHVRRLAKTAKAFGMPIVLSTVGVEYGFNGPTLRQSCQSSTASSRRPALDERVRGLGLPRSREDHREEAH
jgi:nicotinamidase-related amidase